MAKFPKSAWLISKSATQVLKLATRNLVSFHFLGLVHDLGHHSLAIISSYFALFS
jgi:hypothetical protein